MLLEKTTYTTRYTWVDNLSLFYWKLKKKYQFNFSARRHQMVQLPISCCCCCQQQMPTGSCLAKYCATNPLSWDEIHGPTNVDTSSFEGGANCCQNDVEIVNLPQIFANVDLSAAANPLVPPTSAHFQRRVLHPSFIRFLHFTLFQFPPHWIRHQHL